MILILTYGAIPLEVPTPDTLIPVETPLVKSELTVPDDITTDNRSTGSKRKLSHVETEPDVKPSSKDSTTQLLARANKLIKRMKSDLNASQDIVPQMDPPAAQASAKLPNVETVVVRPKRTVYCKLCTFSCDSVQGLNVHHKTDHGVVVCSSCGKNFETKTALDKHMYCHTQPAAFCCEECGQSFPFKSRLTQHQNCTYTGTSFPVQTWFCVKRALKTKEI